MPLKTLLESLDGISEDQQKFYREVPDGENKLFVLDIDQDDFPNHPFVRGLKTALDHEREERRKAKVEIGELKKTQSTWEKQREDLETQLAALGEEGKNFQEKVEKEIGRRTERLEREKETQISALQANLDQVLKERDGFSQDIHRMKIHGATRDSAQKYGARPGSMKFILMEAENEWQIDKDSGDLVALDNKGNIRYGASGRNPLAIDEWMADIAKEHSYLFEPSKGGKATGNTGAPAGNGVQRVSKSALQGMDLKDIASGRVVLSDDT